MMKMNVPTVVLIEETKICKVCFTFLSSSWNFTPNKAFTEVDVDKRTRNVDIFLFPNYNNFLTELCSIVFHTPT